MQNNESPITRLLVLLSLILLNGCSDSEQISESGYGAFEASLAIQKEKIAVAWYDNRDGIAEIYLRFLDQNLEPVSKEIRLTENSAKSYEADLVLLDDAIVVAWYDKQNSGNLSVNLGMWNSRGELLWLKEISPPDSYSRVPVLEVVNQDLFIAWIEDPSDGFAIASPSIIYGAWLDKQGRYISQPYKITEASRTTWNLNANVTQDSTIVLVFDAEYETQASELYLSRITQTSSSTIRLTDDNAKASKYPDIAVNKALAALTWFDEKEGNNEVYLSLFDMNLLLMGGFQIIPLIDHSAKRITHSQGDSIGAYLSWNNDTLGLVWNDNIEGQHEIYFQTFSAEGNNISEIVRVTNSETDSLIPSIKPLSTGYALAWNESFINSHGHGEHDMNSEIFTHFIDLANRAGTSAPEYALYSEAINNPQRWNEDRERDTSSKPEEILKLMDLKPGMAVLDFQAGTGYFTELLSYVTGTEGRVLAHNHSRDGVLDAGVFLRRYGNNRLPNTEQIFAHHNDLVLRPESLDSILMSMVYHDTYWFSENIDWGPVDQQDFLQKLYGALKPGGTIVLIDHADRKGSDPFQSALATHRIDPGVVRKDFKAAGFILELESMVLRNSKDDYSLSVFDESIHGATDRFIMRFQKP